MKHLFINIILLSFHAFNSLGSYAQSTNMNYIYTWDLIFDSIEATKLTNGTEDSLSFKTVQYYDGLGRPLQKIRRGYTSSDEDLVLPYEYNENGIDTVNYKPYSDGTSTGKYRDNYKTVHSNFYLSHFGDQFGMSPQVLEKSELKRLIKQGAPGANWQTNGNSVKYTYNANNQTVKYKVKKWIVTSNGCIFSGYYQNNQIYCTVIEDEDKNTSYEFKDKNDLLILKRVVINSTTFADTYYIYDKIGNLRFVLTPEASFQINSSFLISDAIVKQLAYCYVYDTKNRLIEKRLPGKDFEYFIYNNANEIVLYQDGNMRKTNLGVPKYEWIFTKYDGLGRVIITGITYNYLKHTREQVQDLAILSDVFYEHLIKAVNYPMLNNNYYSNDAFPRLVGGEKILTIDYYDTYLISTPLGRKPIVYEQNMNYISTEASFPLKDDDLNNTNGLRTVNYIDLSGYLLPTVTYYDNKGRILQKRSVNHYKGYDVYSYKYHELTDKISLSEHKHITVSPIGKNYKIVSKEANTYDEELRIIKQQFLTDTLTTQVIEFSYDELDRLIIKELKENKLLRQSVSYNYNIRGWITDINDIDKYPSAGDFFAMRLFYNKEIDQNITTTPKNDGNVSAVKWITGLPKGIVNTELVGYKGYTFTYDGVNNLTASSYLEEYQGKFIRTDKYLEYMPSYDRNGNILSLKRYGFNYSDSQLPLDNLKYSYIGNNVIAIDDSNPYDNGYDFCDNGHYYNLGIDTLEYSYDANGNLIKDVNKGIINIVYNELNLPIIIEKTGNYRLEYEYDASGIKHRQIENRNGKIKTTDFINNFVYEQFSLAWQNFNEGRIVYKNDGSYFAETYIKDHLGNIRVAYGNDGSGFGIRQVNAYYPYGMSISNLCANSTSSFRPNKYCYNGKMFQNELELNWYDYGARFYDPIIARFNTIDPMTDKYSNQSPYIYANNNPINLIDYMGMSAEGYIIDENGYLQHVNNEGGSQYDVIYNKTYTEKKRKDYDKTGKKTGIQVSKSFLASQKTKNYKKVTQDGVVTGKSSNVRYEVKDAKEAANLMTFLDINTNVEWSNTTLEKNNKTLNVIVTSHDVDKVENGTDRLSIYSIDGYKIIADEHIHPESQGSDISGSDYARQNWLTTLNRNAKKSSTKVPSRVIHKGKEKKY